MMNEYQKRYIKLKNTYYDTDGSASSVEDLYEFKELLEGVDEIAAKFVLVDVYMILCMKKSAYELLLKIIDKKDKRQLKTLGYLAQFKDSYGDKFALTRPISSSQKTALVKRSADLPKFTYHPNPLLTGSFCDDMSVVCECCERETRVYYNLSIYSADNVKYLCPDCIASGLAAKKFKATFIQDADELTTPDSAKDDELFNRTPGFSSWQGEHWLACCDDYCEFHGDVGTKELEEMGIADEVFKRYEQRGEFEDVREYLTAGGDMAGYLFRCRHCKKYQIYVDAS